MKAKNLAAALCAFFPSLPPAAPAAEVTVAITGRISPSCRITNASPTLTLGELSRGGSASISFRVACNAPFRYAFSSKNGGLLQSAGAKAQPPFFASLPYTMTFSLGASAGLPVDSCLSSNMTGTAGSCSGRSSPDAAGIQQTATLGFSWDPHGALPVAGSYADILTVTFTAGL